MLLTKVISGGQTGVDRAGLDAAIQFGLSVGGTAPLGGWAEDGTVPTFYGLASLHGPSLEESIKARTAENVRAADATLILRSAAASEGTDLTEAEISRQGKPGRVFVIAGTGDLAELLRIGSDIAAWIEQTPGTTLNIAGPRESEAKLYWKARECLVHAFGVLQRRQGLAPREPSREEAMELFRHWDTIRWQGPAWLSAAAAVLGSIMSSNPATQWAEILRNPLFIVLSLFLAAFGTVSVILQANLISYHRRQEKAFAHLAHLPFSFAGKRLWATASAWLLVYTALLSVALCVPAVIGAWSSPAFETNPAAAWSVIFVAGMLVLTDSVWIIARLVR